MEEYYVYILTDPTRNNEPFYVGKGVGYRAWRHFRRTDDHPITRRIAKIKKSGCLPNVSIFGSLDQEFALFLEIELISKYGRRDRGAGTLWNLTDGGEGQLGNKGVKRSEETCIRMSIAKTGQKYSDEARANMRAGALTRKPYTDERNRKISESIKGRIIPREVVEKRKETMLKCNYPNPMLGRTHSPETREKIRQKQLEYQAKKKAGIV